MPSLFVDRIINYLNTLPQALKFSGRILVAHESFEPGHYGELYDTWEEIEHPDAVQTPAEVG